MKINSILKDEITKLDSTLLPVTYNGSVHETRNTRQTMSIVVDRLGRHSAAAQGLNKTITTAESVMAKGCTLYLYKDAAANNGNGEVVGLLKIARKHLYLAENNGKLHEVEPLCILDFFVEPAYQRQGIGEKLIRHMMKDLGVTLEEMAIDGPSSNMNRFLAKNFGITGMIKQANNFALPPRFFENIDKMRSNACATPTASTGGAGRFTAAQPRSAIGSVIHGHSSPLEHGDSRVVSPRAEAPPAELAAEPPSVAALSVEEPPSAEELPGEEAAGAEEGSRAVERPRSLPVAAAAEPDAAAPSPAGSVLSRRDSQLTEKGFFDVKFYHNKLW